MQEQGHKVAKLSHPALDEKLLLLINREWSSPVLDRIMAAASSFDVWFFPMLLLIAILWWRGRFRVRAFLVTAVFVVAVNDGLVSKTLKRVVDRPRPHQSHNDVRVVDLARAKPRLLALFKTPKVKLSRTSLEDVEGRSFPSSHVVNIFSAALVTVAFFGARFAWVFLIALLVAYSRIYNGSHWPSDVFTSAFLGVGSTLLLLALAEWFWRGAGGRLLPRLYGDHPQLLAS